MTQGGRLVKNASQDQCFVEAAAVHPCDWPLGSRLSEQAVVVYKQNQWSFPGKHTRSRHRVDTLGKQVNGARSWTGVSQATVE